MEERTRKKVATQPAKTKGAAAPEYERTPDRSFSGQPEMDTTNARQGVTGHGVRFVLALSLLAATVTFLWLIFWVY